MSEVSASFHSMSDQTAEQGECEAQRSTQTHISLKFD